jgi:hypothetical protein
MRIVHATLIGVLALGLTAASTSAESRRGRLHVTKECSQFAGGAGSFCTITSSNLHEIPAGTRVYYTQAPVDPTSSEGHAIGLDSNAILFVAAGEWATGRCTLEPMGHGLCTFTNGVGHLAGFHARVAVAPLGGVNYSWIGRYRLGGDADGQ